MKKSELEGIFTGLLIDPKAYQIDKMMNDIAKGERLFSRQNVMSNPYFNKSVLRAAWYLHHIYINNDSYGMERYAVFAEPKQIFDVLKIKCDPDTRLTYLNAIEYILKLDNWHCIPVYDYGQVMARPFIPQGDRSNCS